MTMRPVPARWFEVLIATEDLVKAVEVLARTGDVELEVYSETTQRVSMPNLRDRFEVFDKLFKRYQAYWPWQDLHPSEVPGRPEVRLDEALKKLAEWQTDADPVVEQLETLRRERMELGLILELFEHMPDAEMDFADVANAGPALRARLFVLPLDARIEHLPPAVLSIRITTEQHVFLLVVGKEDAVEAMQREMVLQKGQALLMPAWLKGKLKIAIDQVKQRQIENTQQAAKLMDQLGMLEKKHQLHEVLGDIQQLEWFIVHVTDLPVSENFAWITGWTTDVKDNRINDVMQAQSLRAVVHYPPAPAGVNPPMVFHNPWWSRPFEFFAKLLGVPSVDELDPSLLLSIIVPLLFGYMFGDVGHGLIFVIAGFVLQKRWPLFRLLIGCGISSMLFGWVFGSVFASEQIIEPLWLHPIENPLNVLLLPLAGGVLILLLGLVVNGLQQFWRGEGRQWLAIEVAVIVMYVGLIGGLFEPVIGVLVPIGVIWYLVGNIFLTNEHYSRAIAHALGQMLESVLQLLINTISFIRVGAFALAHAGLSLAVVIMAGTVENYFFSAILFVLGNVLILLLEGLVVSIQTTRLVLFEFFIRFLKGTGRMFRPLVIPEKAAQDKSRRIKV